MGDSKKRGALIFAAAPETDYKYVEAFLGEHSGVMIACADGGLKHLRKLGLYPDLMVTDSDSVKEAEGKEIIRLKTEKDETDTEMCVRELIKRGFTDITLCCATGGRLDHTLANIFLLEEAYSLGGSLTIIDSKNKVVLHKGGTEKFRNDARYRYFSVVAIDRELKGVTIKNVKYPLENVTVRRDRTLTVSNEAAAPEFYVTVKEGTALVIFSKD